MLNSLFSMFHVESAQQLKEIIDNFGHFLPSEQYELAKAIINEIDKGENMNREALAQAAAYLASDVNCAEKELQNKMAENNIDMEQLFQNQSQTEQNEQNNQKEQNELNE